MAGFRALGPRAAPAVPELVRIYDQKYSWETTYAVTQAFTYIGPGAKAAVPSLVRDAGSTNLTVRMVVFAALENIHANPDATVPVLIKGLQDPLTMIVSDSILGLGEFGPEAKAAVPALVDLIKKARGFPEGTVMPKEADVRRIGVEALKKIDPEAADKLLVEIHEEWRRK